MCVCTCLKACAGVWRVRACAAARQCVCRRISECAGTCACLVNDFVCHIHVRLTYTSVVDVTIAGLGGKAVGHVGM